jgi:ABC-type phosphate transport system substrate-binding protein
MRLFRHWLAALMALTLISTAFAEVSVIVHPSNNSALDKDTISRIFLGKNRGFPGGGDAIPVTFKEGTPASDQFTENVLSKSPKQLKSYWAKMIFTGKGTPPKQMDADAEVVSLVSKNPSVIGYVTSGSEGPGVKVVAKF